MIRLTTHAPPLRRGFSFLWMSAFGQEGTFKKGEPYVTSLRSRAVCSLRAPCQIYLSEVG